MGGKISVITVNYNGFDDTCQMVESLMGNVTSPMEIIVVDNASKRDEAALLAQKYPGIKTIRSEKNLGFAGGNNLGLTEATGDYIFLLNNDAFVEDDSLHTLCERLDSSPKIGAVSPKIIFADPPRNIQFAGYTPLSGVTLRNSLIGFDSPDNGQYDTPHTSPYAHGAAMMVKREVIERVGAMTEIYFLYYEELDWSSRITDSGYEIWYEPRCRVYHKESRSTGRQSPLRVYYITRNRLLYGWRNRRGVQRWLTVLYQTVIAAPKNFLTMLLKGEFSQAFAVWRGCAGFFAVKHKMQL